MAAWISRDLDWLVTVDPHLHRIADLSQVSSVPTRIAHAAEGVARWVRSNVKQPLLIGPDEESAQWVRDVPNEGVALACHEVLDVQTDS